MSTYVHLVCLSHDPPLVADDESGQHLYDLPQIRADIADRETLVAAWQKLDYPDRGHFFLNNTIRFLARHLKCQIGIEDEYGVQHSITEEEP